MDEKKRIIEFDAAESVPVDGQLPIDSASQGTKKITPALLLKDITDLLGNAPLETQAQVLTAAVNEVNAKAAQATHLTQAEWDALPNTKYTDDVAYFITDGESTVGTALWTKVGTAGLNTNAKNCSGAINELKGTLTVKAKEISGTTDAQGRLLSTGFSIANKAVVGVISGGHGQIALQLRLSNNNFAVKFLDSSGMSVIANTSCSCIVYYVDTFEIQT